MNPRPIAFGASSHANADSALSIGTSSGFGKRLVKSILARGDYVIATVRALDRFQIPLSDEERCRVHVLVFDLADTHENIQKLAAKAAGLWGRIDVLVNNAGVAPKSLLEELGCVVPRTPWVFHDTEENTGCVENPHFHQRSRPTFSAFSTSLTRSCLTCARDARAPLCSWAAGLCSSRTCL